MLNRVDKFLFILVNNTEMIGQAFMGSLLVWITPHSHCSAAYNPHDLFKGMFQVKAAIRNFFVVKNTQQSIFNKCI